MNATCKWAGFNSYPECILRRWTWRKREIILPCYEQLQYSKSILVVLLGSTTTSRPRILLNWRICTLTVWTNKKAQNTGLLWDKGSQITIWGIIAIADKNVQLPQQRTRFQRNGNFSIWEDLYLIGKNWQSQIAWPHQQSQGAIETLTTTGPSTQSTNRRSILKLMLLISCL